MVTYVPAVMGRLPTPARPLITGESYENRCTAELVPIEAATVSTTGRDKVFVDVRVPAERAAVTMHTTALVEVHAVVVQSDEPTETVGVASTPAKLKPPTVMVTPPQTGVLYGAVCEATGASKVNLLRKVPVTAATVIDTGRAARPSKDETGGRQRSEVAATYAVDWQSVDPIWTDGVPSTTPKFMPTTVRLRPTVPAKFAVDRPVITGPS